MKIGMKTSPVRMRARIDVTVTGTMLALRWIISSESKC
jgi:hypothetical protein